MNKLEDKIKKLQTRLAVLEAKRKQQVRTLPVSFQINGLNDEIHNKANDLATEILDKLTEESVLYYYQEPDYMHDGNHRIVKNSKGEFYHYYDGDWGEGWERVEQDMIDEAYDTIRFQIMDNNYLDEGSHSPAEYYVNTELHTMEVK